MAITPVGWATDEFDADKHPTKVIVPANVQATGLVKGEPMGRQWFNYLLNYILARLDGIGVATADASHEVRYFTAQQPNLVANGWRLVDQRAAAGVTPAPSPAVTLYGYEQVGK